MTRFSFYDHDATQSECAHRLAWAQSVNKRAGPRFLSVGRILMSGLDQLAKVFSFLPREIVSPMWFFYFITLCEA